MELLISLSGSFESMFKFKSSLLLFVISAVFCARASLEDLTIYPPMVFDEPVYPKWGQTSDIITSLPLAARILIEKSGNVNNPSVICTLTAEELADVVLSSSDRTRIPGILITLYGTPSLSKYDNTDDGYRYWEGTAKMQWGLNKDTYDSFTGILEFYCGSPIRSSYGVFDKGSAVKITFNNVIKMYYPIISLPASISLKCSPGKQYEYSFPIQLREDGTGSYFNKASLKATRAVFSEGMPDAETYIEDYNIVNAAYPISQVNDNITATLKGVCADEPGVYQGTMSITYTIE